MLGQSLGSLVLGVKALLSFVPSIYIDTMGYSSTMPSSCAVTEFWLVAMAMCIVQTCWPSLDKTGVPEEELKENGGFPRKLFRKFADVEEDYFKQEVAGINRKEPSVSDSIGNYFKLSKRKNLAALIHEEMSITSFAEVKDVFPGHFEDGVLDSFAAAIGGKIEGNSAAADFKEYCNSVLGKVSSLFHGIVCTGAVYDPP